jgi:MinD-like ATPase involved in chromosome partitioning or flagellar assembly
LFVVSFYSYKGGVGRSVALLNTAWELASKGHRVALMDLDLEAPGLHEAPLLEEVGGAWVRPTFTKSFQSFVEDFQRGTMRLDRETACQVVQAHFQGGLGPGGRLSLLPATSGESANYADFLSRFSWENFYKQEEHPGKLATNAIVYGLTEAGYDYLLIDARTGLTDVRATALVDMPDLVVMITNLTRQSVEGIAGQLDHLRALNDEIVQHGSRRRRVGRTRTPIETLVVGSPLPTGELRTREDRIREINERLAEVDAAIDVELDYLPALAIDEGQQIVAQLLDPTRRSEHRAGRPYLQLAQAIIDRNPAAVETLLAQGDRLMELQLWREALTHYDAAHDRLVSVNAPPDLLLARAVTSRLRAQAVAPSQVVQAIKDLKAREAELSKADPMLPVQQHLRAAWTLVVKSAFRDAAKQAAASRGLAAKAAGLTAQGAPNASPATRSARTFIELFVAASLVEGQALRLDGRATEATVVLSRASEVAQRTTSLPILGALVRIELARACTHAGLIHRGVDALADLRTPTAGSAVKARLQLAAAELALEQARGRDASVACAEGYRAFVHDNDDVGALEVLAVWLEFAAGTGSVKEQPAWLKTWRRKATEVALDTLDHNFSVIWQERRLAAAGPKGLDGALDPLLAARLALCESQPTALVSVPPGDPRDHSTRLVRAVDRLAHQADPSAELPDEYLAKLREGGSTLRLVQATFVRALSSPADEAALAELVRPLDLTDWLWNLPLAFIAHVPSMAAQSSALLHRTGIPWPVPGTLTLPE